MSDDYQRALDQARADLAMTERGLCSECGGVLEKKLDQRQDGFPGHGATEGFAWHNMRCTACGYRFDQVLRIDSNDAAGPVPDGR